MVKEKVIIIVFLILFGFLHFSKAQVLVVKSADHQNLEGAVVVFASIADGNSQVRFADNRGEVIQPKLATPLIRKVSLIGYESKVDTFEVFQAGNSVVILKQLPKNLDQVTVTGSYLPGYQSNSIYNIDVLNRADIEKRGAVNIKDLLSQELNMRISNDGVLGSNLSIQGISGENLKFLIDGIPVIGRQNGNIDLNQLNLQNIERVEVVKGPMSVLYGTDALGGVVNLITKSNSKQNLSGSLNGYFESTGQYNADFSTGWGFKKSAINIDGGRNFFDGWSKNDTARSQQWLPKEQYFGNIKVSHLFNKIKIGFQSGYFNETVYNQSNVTINPNYAYAIDQHYHTQRLVNQLTLEKRFSETSSLQMVGAYSYYRYIKNTYAKDMVALTEALTPDTNDDDTTKFNSVFARAVYTQVFNKKFTLIAGSDLNSESAFGKKIDGSTHSFTDIGVFANLDYNVSEFFTVRPSIRGIYNSQYDAPLVPSLNVMFKPSSKFIFRASYSVGFRAPSLKEQHLNFNDNGVHNIQGNINLNAEKSNNILVSLDYKKALKSALLTIEPSLFYNEIYNRISLVQVSQLPLVYSYVNLDKFIAKGAELKLKYAVANFQVNAGAVYTGTWNTIEGSGQQPEVAWYPEYNAAADYTFSKQKITCSVFWKYLGERPIFVLENNDNVVRYVNDPFQFLDFTLRKILFKENISITAGVKNILDVTNIDSMNNSGVHSVNGVTQIAMGRSFFTKLTINLR
jgi:outer membrane receptor for ferrienterochelin and colicins